MDILFHKPLQKEVDLLVIAGEHSGDEHAARMVGELKARNPDLHVCAIGGPLIERAGAQLLFDLTRSSVVGLVEVLRNYSFFKKLFTETLSWIWKYRPRVVCFVDYPGFNLRVARQLYKDGLARKGGGDVTLCYYISPQIWAWKAKRRFEMAKWLDSLAVIFPFEVDCYKDTDLDVQFVGHPFMEEGFENPLRYEAGGDILLLPGSRKAAVKRILPAMLDAFKLYLRKYPEARAVVMYPSEDILKIEERIVGRFKTLGERIKFLSADEGVGGGAVLGSSGTMSLKCALAGIPGGIVYKAHPLTYFIGKILVDIDRLGMANILLDKFVYPEYIQDNARADVLSYELDEAIHNPERRRLMEEAAGELRDVLSQRYGQSPSVWMERMIQKSTW